MITVNIHELNAGELDQLSKYNFTQVTCACGQSISVQPDTSMEDSVRCRHCTSNVSYHIDWDKDKGRADLVTRRPNESFDYETFFSLRKELTEAENLLLNELADHCRGEGGQELIASFRNWFLKMHGLLASLELDMIDLSSHYKWLKEIVGMSG